MLNKTKLAAILLITLSTAVIFSLSTPQATAAPKSNITFKVNGICSDTDGNIILTIDDIKYDYSALNCGVTLRWDRNSIHTITASTPVASCENNKQYRFSSWTNGGSELTESSGTYKVPTSDTTVTANYVTQYKQKVTSSPATGKGFVSVDETDVSTPYTEWWDCGSTHTITANSPVNLITNQSRYTYTSWSDAQSQQHIVSPTCAKTYTANFQLQYYLAVSGGDGNGAGWYNNGASASSTASYVVDQVSNQSRNNLYQKIVDGTPTVLTRAISGTVTQTVTMNTYHNITWEYKTQYYLSVNNGGHGTAGGEGWYDTGTNAQATITPLIDPITEGTQYVFCGWSVDASGVTSPSDAITMDGVKMAVATWKIQYQVTFTSSPAGEGMVTPLATTWTDSGANVPISATPTEGYRFSGWSTTGAIGIADPTNTETYATINGPGTIIAQFETAPTSTPTPEPTDSPTPPASPSPSAPSILETTLTLTCNPQTVTRDNTNQTTLTGKLTSQETAVPAKPIELSYFDGAHWIPIVTATTDADGVYSYVWEVPSTIPNGQYSVKAVFGGDGTYRASSAGTTSGPTLFVLPEYLWGGLAALGACFLALVLFKNRNNVKVLRPQTGFS
jgi:hypothetical protein